MPRLESLIDPGALRELFGPIVRCEAEPLATVGFSGATHHRLRLTFENGSTSSLVLKRAPLAKDWVARRSGDLAGREGLLLAEPALAGVWEIFRSPYRAYAIEGGEVGLLMDDLGDHLFPDVREPLAARDERALLDAFARLHARFWGSEVLRLPWLARPANYFGIVSPGAAAEEASRGPLPPVLERAAAGWESALARLSAPVKALMTQPAAAIAARCEGLPHTLLHGDSKVANFAILPDRSISAFDWGLLGAAPPTLELGWYLAVNATRLAGSREETIAGYRDRLEAARGEALASGLWQAMLDAGILDGARMLLWSKALGFESGAARARDEWEWWVGHLERIARA